MKEAQAKRPDYLTRQREFDEHRRGKQGDWQQMMMAT